MWSLRLSNRREHIIDELQSRIGVPHIFYQRQSEQCIRMRYPTTSSYFLFGTHTHEWVHVFNIIAHGMRYHVMLRSMCVCCLCLSLDVVAARIFYINANACSSITLPFHHLIHSLSLNSSRPHLVVHLSLSLSLLPAIIRETTNGISEAKQHRVITRFRIQNRNRFFSVFLFWIFFLSLFRRSFVVVNSYAYMLIHLFLSTTCNVVANQPSKCCYDIDDVEVISHSYPYTVQQHIASARISGISETMYACLSNSVLLLFHI